ncbi:hypothetical protein [Sphingobacterium siyangense]|uniref:hypothetical protein n=1 Tax=Sphingobacterium siyangense TaxID=459529 RepID=UPI002FDEE1D1
MKTIFLFLCALFISSSTLKAQTFAEWFRQKKTQKQYLIEQIAALKVYSEYVKKGYDIGKKGLGTISQIKNGDFNLHRDFFGALATVNPAFKHDPRVAEIQNLQVSILAIKDQVLRNQAKSDLLNKKENRYIALVFERLIENCSHILDQLDDVALSGNLTMKDDERLDRINQLHMEMADNYRFAYHFKNQVVTLAASRLQEQREVTNSNSLFGIK